MVDEGNTVYTSRGRVGNQEDAECNVIIERSTNTLILGCAGSAIPETVTSIAEGAFNQCKFTTITIPSSVDSIGAQAFYACNELTSVISYITEPFTLAEEFSNGLEMIVP